MVLSALGAILVAPIFARAAFAEIERKTPRIGVLVPVGLDSIVPQFLRQALAQRGYLDGRSVTMDWRTFRGGGDDLKAAATALVETNPDLIIAVGTGTARAAMAATTTIPIVFISGDPIAGNLADSLSRPGRNATGVSILSTDLVAKRVEYLHMLAPRARKVGFLMNSTSPIESKQFQEVVVDTARALGLKATAIDCRSPEELVPVLAALQRDPPDGIVISGNPLFFEFGAKLAAALRATRRPAIFPFREYHQHGVLISYGPSLKETWSRVAGYVDRILKGARPAEQPIEQSTKLDLVVDMRVARALRITVPDSLLTRADEVLR